MSLQSGQIVGRYELERELGRGGMGVVWRATDTLLKRPVAIKFLRTSDVRDGEQRERFLREARLASQVSDAHVAQVYEFAQEGAHAFIVMEYVEGSSLGDVAAGRPLPARRVAHIGWQVAQALARAHRKGLIHRDLKPQNILVTPDGDVKVVDFGLAILWDSGDDGPGSTATTEMLKDSGVARMSSVEIAGTLPYMSPEQVRGEQLDRRSDVFSLGCVLYEMVTGKKPFQASSPMEIIEQISSRSPPALESLVPSVPIELRRIVVKAMSKSRRDRYQSTEDLAIDLKHLAQELDTGSSPSLGDLRKPAPDGQPGRSMAWAWLAIPVLILLAVAAWEYSPWQASPSGPARPAVSIRQRPLTTNAMSDPVVAAAISPDGKLLAYVASGGDLHIKDLATGASKRMDLGEAGEVEKVSWFPGGSRLLISHAREGEETSISSVSYLTEEVRLLRQQAVALDVSPAGDWIAFYPAGDPDIWLMDTKGGNAHRLVQREGDDVIVWWAAWAPNGERILFRRQTRTDEGVRNRLETVSLDGRERSVVLPAEQHIYPGLHAVWPRMSQILYTRATAGGQMNTTTLWEIRINPETWEPEGPPRELITWDGAYYLDLHATADGEKVSAQRYWDDENIWLLDLAKAAGAGDGLRRLTTDSAVDFKAAWSPDGSRLAFASNRRGTFDLFTIPAGGGPAGILLTEAGHEDEPAYTPDGRWVLYRSADSFASLTGSEGVDIMAMPAGGGPSRKILESTMFGHVACPVSPSALCIVAEWKNGETRFATIDPEAGRGPDLVSLETEIGPPEWALDAAGERLAVFNLSRPGHEPQPLSVIDLASGTISSVPLQAGATVRNGAWDPDGEHLVAQGGIDAEHAILRIDLQGNVEPLLRGRIQGAFLRTPRVSPDGTAVAFDGVSRISAVWLIEGY